MSYYHCLGGYYENKGIVKNRIKKEHLLLLTDPISLYRLYKILKDGKIKCRNDIHNDLDNYIRLKYDKDSVYLATVSVSKGEYTSVFEDWSGYSISLKIREDVKKDLETLPEQNLRFSNLEGEIRVKNSIPLSYVEAICIPIYSHEFYRIFSSDAFHDRIKPKLSDNVMKYLNDIDKEMDLVKKILKMANIEIPIIETFTDEPLDDISKIIDELESIEMKERVEYVRKKKNILANNK